MSAYIIVTDSNADLVPGFAAENQILELELTYTIDGSTCLLYTSDAADEL